MASNHIVITELEMVSALGLDVKSSCAGARAGLVKLSPIKVINSVGNELLGNDPLNGHIIPCGISHGFVGPAKALIIGGYALNGLINKINSDDLDLERTGIILNLSDGFLIDAYAISDSEDGTDSIRPFFSEKREQEYGEFIKQLLDGVGLEIPPSNQKLLFGGRSGLAHALKNAVTSIQNGHFEKCIIGGIDSCIEPQFLAAAAQMTLLKTSTNPNGFIPGEGAGFIILEKISEEKIQGEESKAIIGSVAVQFESENANRLSDDSPVLTALTETINTVMAHALTSGQKIGLIIGDLNGDEYKAMEWGYASIRLENKYNLGSLPLWLPAINFGETGAAAGVFAICMCIKGFQRGYSSSEKGTLIFLSGDNGEKAALTLFRNK